MSTSNTISFQVNQNDFKNQQKKISELLKELRQIQHVNEELQSEINRKNEQISNSNDENQKLDEQIEGLEHQNEHLRNTVGEASKEISMLRDENKNLKQIVESYEDQLEKIGDVGGELNVKNSDLLKMKHEFTVTKEKLEEEIEILKRNHEEQTEKLRDNDSVSKHLEAEKNTLTIELTEANKEMENLQEKTNSLLQKHSEELARMKNNNDRLLEENENFSKYLKEAESTVAQFSERERKLQNANIELTERLDHLERNHRDIKTELTQSNVEWDDAVLNEHAVEIEKDREQIISLKKSLKEKEDELSSANEMIQKQHQQLTKFPDSKTLLDNGENSQLNILREANLKLQQDKGALHKEKELLKIKCASVEKDLSENELVVNALRKQKVDTENKNKELHILLDQVNTNVAELEKAKSFFEQKCKEAEEVKEQLVVRGEDVLEEKNTLDMSLKEKSSYLDDMEKNLTLATKQIFDLQVNIEKEVHEKEMIEYELNNYKLRLEELEETKNKLNSELKEAEKEAKQFKLMENNAMQNNLSLEQTIMKKELEFQRLQRQYLELEAKHNNLSEELEQTKKLLSDLEDGNSNMSIHNGVFNERLKNLESQLEKKDGVISHLRKENMELVNLKDKLLQIKAGLEDDIARVSSEKEEIYKELTNIQENVVPKNMFQGIESLLADQVKINKELTKKLTIAESTAKQLQDSVVSLKADIKRESDISQDKLRKVTLDLNNKIKINESLEIKLKTAEEKYNQLVKEHDQIREEVEDKRSNCASMCEQLEIITAERSELSHALASSKKHCDVMKEETEKEKAKMQEKKQKLLELQRQFLQQQRTEEQLKERNSTLIQELDEINERYENLKKSMSVLRSQVEEKEMKVSQLASQSSNCSLMQEEVEKYKRKLANVASSYEICSQKLDQKEVELSSINKKFCEVEIKLKSSIENEIRLKSLLEETEDLSVSKEAYNLVRTQLNEKNTNVELLESKILNYEEKLQLLNRRNEKDGELHESLKHSLEEALNEIKALKLNVSKQKEEKELNQSKMIDQRTIFKEMEDDIARKSKELLDKMEIIEKLSQEVEEATLKYDDLRHDNKNMQLKIDNLLNLNSELSNKVELLSEQIKDKNKMVSGLKHKNERIERKEQAYTSELEQCRALLRSEEKKCNDVQNKLVELTRIEEEQVETIEDLTQRKEELNIVVNKVKHEINILEGKLEETSGKLDKTKQEYDMMYRKHNAIKNKLKETENENKNNMENLALLRSNHENVTKQLKNAKTEVTSYRNQVTRISDDLEESQKKNSVLENENSNLKEKFLEMETEYSELLENYDNLQKNADVTTEELEMTRHSLKKLETNKKHIVNEREVMKSEVDTVSEKLTALNAALDRSRVQRQQLLEELNHSKHKANDLETAGEESKQAIVKRLVETENKLSASETQCEELMDKNESLMKNISSIERTNQELSTNNKSLQVVKKESEIKLKELEKELEQKKRYTQELIEEISELQKEREIIQQESNAKDNSLTKAQEKLVALFQRVEQLEQDTNELSAINKRLNKENKKQQNDLSRANHNIEQFRINEASLEKQLDNGKRTLKSTSQHVSVVEAEKCELMGKLTDAENRKEYVQDALDRLQKNFESKCKEITTFEPEVINLLRKYEISEKQARQRDDELKDVTKRRHELQEQYAALDEAFQNVNNELSRYKGEVQCLEALKENLEKEHEKVISECIEFKSKTDSMDRLNEKNLKENSDLKLSLENQQGYLLAKTKEIRILGEENDELKRKVGIYEQEKKDAVAEQLRISNSNQLLSAKLGRMQDETLREVTQKYTETIKLKAELDAVKRELQKRNRNLEKQFSSTISENEFVSMEINYKKEIVMLKEQLERLCEDEAKSRSELNLTKNKFSMYLKEKERLESEQVQLLSELECEKSKTNVSERQLEAYNKRQEREKETGKRKLEGVCQDYQKRISYLEHQIEALKTTHSLELEAKIVEVDSLKRDLSNKRNERW